MSAYYSYQSIKSLSCNTGASSLVEMTSLEAHIAINITELFDTK